MNLLLCRAPGGKLADSRRDNEEVQAEVSEDDRLVLEGSSRYDGR